MKDIIITKDGGHAQLHLMTEAALAWALDAPGRFEYGKGSPYVVGHFACMQIGANYADSAANWAGKHGLTVSWEVRRGVPMPHGMDSAFAGEIGRAIDLLHDFAETSHPLASDASASARKLQERLNDYVAFKMQTNDADTRTDQILDDPIVRDCAKGIEPMPGGEDEDQ